MKEFTLLFNYVLSVILFKQGCIHIKIYVRTRVGVRPYVIFLLCIMQRIGYIYIYISIRDSFLPMWKQFNGNFFLFLSPTKAKARHPRASFLQLVLSQKVADRHSSPTHPCAIPICMYVCLYILSQTQSPKIKIRQSNHTGIMRSPSLLSTYAWCMHCLHKTTTTTTSFEV